MALIHSPLCPQAPSLLLSRNALSVRQTKNRNTKYIYAYGQKLNTISTKECNVKMLLGIFPRIFSLFYIDRLQICALHFNENSARAAKETVDGAPVYDVSYRKYKGGRATVRRVKVAPTYSKSMNI